jgi:hypothetical protein
MKVFGTAVQRRRNVEGDRADRDRLDRHEDPGRLEHRRRRTDWLAG